MKLPFFTPFGWLVLFLGSLSVGIVIAIQMLVLRGLW